MTRTAPARQRAGFSLLEVMIALAVLTVGLLGMMHLQIIGIVSNSTGRKHTVATELADELVSGIERLPFGDPLLLPTGSTGPTAPTPFGRLVTGNTLSASASAARLVGLDARPGVRKTTRIGPSMRSTIDAGRCGVTLLPPARSRSSSSSRSPSCTRSAA
jgi:prepilin-type N-terminal cleavage/methylation domain-containing protein